jgi:putative endonuclease
MIEKGGWAYIMSSHSRCLYIGVTSDLPGRVWEHKNGVLEGFSKKYKTHDLVYQEFLYDIESAIAREKQLKGWSRAKKIALIEKINPGWEDLAPSFDHLGPSTPARPS